LAAGRQKRMNGVLEIPKGLVKVKGKALVTRVVEGIVQAGIKQVLLITNREFEGVYRKWREEMKNKEMIVEVVSNGLGWEDRSAGALGDLQKALRIVIKKWKEVGDTIISPSDTQFEGKLIQELLEFYARYQGDFCTVIRDMGEVGEIRGRLGCVEVGEDSRVVSFEEKPEKPKLSLAAIPFYVIPKRMYKLLDEYLESGENPDAPGLWIPWLLKRGEKVRAYEFKQYTKDVGTPEDVALVESL